jgi:hypothetical protein
MLLQITSCWILYAIKVVVVNSIPKMLGARQAIRTQLVPKRC